MDPAHEPHQPGTGRLGRGAASYEPVTLADLRRFAASDFATRLAALVTALVGLALLVSFTTRGGALPDAPSGLLRPDATPLTPAGVEHLAWLPGLALVTGYGLWAWLPWSQRSRRVDVTAYPALASLLLLLGWVAAVQGGRVRTSLLLAILTWAALARTLRRGLAERAGLLDRQLTQLPFAVLLGQMTVMVAATVGVVAREWGFRPPHVVPETWWVLGVVATMVAAMVTVRYLPGRVVVGVVVAWGFVGIAYARVVGHPKAFVVALAALASALIVVASAAAVLMWIRSHREP